jgi:site-specific DNA-methyltransferase (adenine-specific)
MPDCSVDSIVTDPPYGLSFMNKRWDYDVPGVEVWAECLRVLKPGGHLLSFAGTRTQHRMAVRIEDAGFEIRDMIAWVYGSGFPKGLNVSKAIGQWNGWNTALKPAIEPITVARKPMIGTVAENVLQHGTGALNIDGCRIGSSDGRWPANLIHDGSEEVLAGFPHTAPSRRYLAGSGRNDKGNKIYGKYADIQSIRGHNDNGGSAARFFYCAKANKADRGEANNHPTVKPTDLMRYLCRLVTPPNGIVLDPFNGSGSTGCAAILEGFQYIGIERETEYIAISEKRIQTSSDQVQKQSKQLTLL